MRDFLMGSRRTVGAVVVSKPEPADSTHLERVWRVIGDGDRFVLRIPDLAIEFELDRPHRDRGELVGQLTVRTDLKGARVSVDRTLNVGTFNASSSSAKQTRAKTLAELSRAPQIDWHRLVEEFATRALIADVTGQPAVSLRDVPDDGEDDHYDLDGVIVTRRSPSMIFGDAGTAKSFWGLHQLGRLADRGVRCALVDWELDALAHKRRLRAMFGDSMPYVLHIACSRPLIYEVDRIRRIIVDEEIQYLGLDSVAPACHDEPSSAEAATAFFRAVRQLGVGTLLVAHTPKAVELGQERPFGSQFWYALCRSIWFVAAQPAASDSGRLVVGFYHRKSNLSRLMPAMGFSFDFTQTSTAITRCDLAEVDGLSERMPLWQRMRDTLRAGPLPLDELAERLQAKPDAIKKAAQRGTRTFTKVLGSDGVTRLALVERRTA
jgi:hypothetical protein